MDGFCAQISLQRCEPLWGTAPHGRVHVFITWPKSAWAHDTLDAVGFPPDAAALLAGLRRRAGVLTRLIHSPDRCAVRNPERCDVLVFPAARRLRNVPVSDLCAALEQVIERDDWTGADCLPDARRHVFCCTHGTRDRCCAKFGFAAYRALREGATRSGHDIRVWECTHLGGDRFAANASVFPQGHMYGRIGAEDVDRLLADVARGRPHGRLYRGSVFLPPLPQLAEAWAWHHCAAHGLTGGVDVGEADPVSPGEARIAVAIAGAGGARYGFDLTCRQSPRIIFSDCRALDAEAEQTRLRWEVAGARRTGVPDREPAIVPAG